MRILIITHYLPWPLNSGGNTAQFSTLKCLANDHDYVVICALYEPGQLAHLPQLQAALPEVKFIGVPIWEDKIGATDKNPLLRFARKSLQQLRQWFVGDEKNAHALYNPFQPVSASLLNVVSKELAKGVDLCQVEFAELMSLACWLPSHLPKLFVHHQIHFVYSRRFIEVRGGAGGPLGYLASMMEAQEIAYLRYYSGVITFSREDKAAIQPRLPGVTVFTSPFPIPADLNEEAVIASAFSGNFYFVASGSHNPNRDAIEWLLDSIWPQISSGLPGARLHIIGEWSKKDKAALGRPGVVFRGFVKELSPVLQGGIMLVPLRIGSGLRVKILAALTLGVPVVTTSIGAEGLLVTHGEELLVADTPDQFANAALSLAKEPGRWAAMAKAGKAAVKRHYSPSAIRAQRNEIYQSLASSKRIV
jgi:glycosyltransferase involved in cell wall biosynthesis